MPKGMRLAIVLTAAAAVLLGCAYGSMEAGDMSDTECTDCLERPEDISNEVRNQEEEISEEEKIIARMLEKLEDLLEKKKTKSSIKDPVEKDCEKGIDLISGQNDLQGNNNHVKKNLKCSNDNDSAEEGYNVGVSVKRKSGAEEFDTERDKPTNGIANEITKDLAKGVLSNLVAILKQNMEVVGDEINPYGDSQTYPVLQMNPWKQMAYYSPKNAFPFSFPNV